MSELFTKAVVDELAIYNILKTKKKEIKFSNTSLVSNRLIVFKYNLMCYLFFTIGYYRLT